MYCRTGGPIEDLRPRLAADRDVLLEIARGELRHRDPGSGGGRGIVPGLDAGNDAGRLLPRLAGRDRPVAPDGDTPGPSLSPALHHEGLGAGGVDPHPEAGEVPVPEDRVPLRDGESPDGPRGELPAPGHGHGARLDPVGAGPESVFCCNGVSIP